MVQKDGVGGGTSQDEKYTTWELKHCKKCGRHIIEYYEARLIAKSLLDDMLEGESILLEAELVQEKIKGK